MLCFKLYAIKDATICTTAAATVRQMVSVIFERVLTEDSQGLGKNLNRIPIPVFSPGCGLAGFLQENPIRLQGPATSQTDFRTSTVK